MFAYPAVIHSRTTLEDASLESTLANKTSTKSNDFDLPRLVIKLAVKSLNKFQNCPLEVKSRVLGGKGMMSPSAARRALIVKYEREGDVSRIMTSYCVLAASMPLLSTFQNSKLASDF